MYIKKLIEMIKNTSRVPENKFYLYEQNNSEGVFQVDHGVDINVIIEANNIYMANKIAKRHGVYFNGVDKNIDCDCCGDRWSDSPQAYDKLTDALRNRLTMFGGQVVIYMANGEVYRAKEEER